MDLIETAPQITTAPRTVFDTPEWAAAWSRSTIEDSPRYDAQTPGYFAVESSPFWRGYEVDAVRGPLWDLPLLTIGSLYSFYGPGYLAGDPDAVRQTMARAHRRAAEWSTCGVLIAHLPEPAARTWARYCPPDAAVRLDIAYHREIGLGEDGITGDVTKKVRVDWRRRWRRATEKGLRLVREPHPGAARVHEVIGLANQSAVRHGWPQVYDFRTAAEILSLPGATLIRADWEGSTVAGFIALEYQNTLNLWAGGTHETALREVSPYLFLLYELLSGGAERGLRRIEFGRGNDAFKRKYGFEGTNTWSLWYGRDAAQAARYAPRLEELNDVLSDVMGVQRVTLDRPAAPQGR